MSTFLGSVTDNKLLQNCWRDRRPDSGKECLSLCRLGMWACLTRKGLQVSGLEQGGSQIRQWLAEIEERGILGKINYKLRIVILKLLKMYHTLSNLTKTWRTLSAYLCIIPKF